MDRREKALKAIHDGMDAYQLKEFQERYAHDADFILEAADRYGEHILYLVDESHFEDADFVLKAIRYSDSILERVPNLRDKRALVLEAVQINGMVIQNTPFYDDEEIVLAAVNNNGHALEYASEKLRDNHNMVLAAVNNNGGALKFASKWWRDDYGIVSAAIKSNGWALGYASKRLRRDAALVLKAVEFNGETFQYADITLRNDKKVVLAAVLLDEFAMDYIGKDIRKLVGKHGNIVEILSHHIEMGDLNKGLHIKLPKDETKKTKRSKGI